MKEDVEDKDLPGLPPKQLTKIKSKMKSSWFKSLMLKKKVVTIWWYDDSNSILANWMLIKTYSTNLIETTFFAL